MMVIRCAGIVRFTCAELSLGLPGPFFFVIVGVDLVMNIVYSKFRFG
jgi:hypothetical protein